MLSGLWSKRCWPCRVALGTSSLQSSCIVRAFGQATEVICAYLQLQTPDDYQMLLCRTSSFCMQWTAFPAMVDFMRDAQRPMQSKGMLCCVSCQICGCSSAFGNMPPLAACASKPPASPYHTHMPTCVLDELDQLLLCIGTRICGCHCWQQQWMRELTSIG